MATTMPILIDRMRFKARYGIAYEVLGGSVREVPGVGNTATETLWFRRTPSFREALDIAVGNLVSERARGILEAKRRLGPLRFVPDALISALLFPFGTRMRALAEQIKWLKEEIVGHEEALADIAARRTVDRGLAGLVDFTALPDFIPMPFSPRPGQPFWTLSFSGNADDISMRITTDRISRIVIVENFAPKKCLFDVRCESDSGVSFCGFDIDRENACFRAKGSGIYHHLTREGAQRHARRIARRTAVAVAGFLLPEKDYVFPEPDCRSAHADNAGI